MEQLRSRQRQRHSQENQGNQPNAKARKQVHGKLVSGTAEE